MKIVTHQINQRKIAEIIADDCVLRTAEDGLDLLGNLYFQGFDGLILQASTITPDFFDLKSGIAG
jgi:hypothetical protein